MKESMSHDSERAEIARLRDEYDRRRQRPSEATSGGDDFIHEQRRRETLRMLTDRGLLPRPETRILEVGCGSGAVLREMLRLGAGPNRLVGLDLLEWRLREAHQALPEAMIVNGNGCHLPFADGTFDLVLQFTAFSSILDSAIRRTMAREMRRVLRPGGSILWYDFWINPANPRTRGIRPPELRRLFPGCQFDLKRITLAPPVARLLAPVSWELCRMLERLKLLNTHYLAAIRPL